MTLRTLPTASAPALAAALLLSACATAQQTTQVPAPVSRTAVDAKRAYADLVYLASDELAGRRTGTAGNVAAADYIAAELRRAGARPVGGAPAMKVGVPLVDRNAVAKASLSFGESRTALPDGLLPLSREGATVTAPLLYTDRAAVADPGPEVAGRIVVTEAGSEEDVTDVGTYVALSRQRAAALARAGAVALVEVYRSPVVPFPRLAGGLNRGGMILDDGSAPRLPSVYVKAGVEWDDLRRERPTGTTATLEIVAPRTERLTSHNVIAVIPGTDPELADEYVAVTAHFDHIGVTARPGLTDSINNGARDNGMGTVALLEVARHFGANPAPRPLLLMAWTAEEEGLLGSEYWAANPTVPLNEVVFNFNMDGAGYTDTTAVVFNGYGFTATQNAIDAAVAKTGLTPLEDPVPESRLYGASDNYSLARVGIPAINMAPGFRGFDEALMRYFHQPADEASAVSPTYLGKYATAAIAAVRAVAVADAESLDWNRESELLRDFVDLED